MMITPLAPLARALIAFTSSVHVPRWTSTKLSFTAAGKSCITQPLFTVLLAVGCGETWMPAAGITCAVMSALWLQVICAKSLAAAVPLRNGPVPACGVIGVGEEITSSVEGVLSDHVFGVLVFA